MAFASRRLTSTSIKLSSRHETDEALVQPGATALTGIVSALEDVQAPSASAAIAAAAAATVPAAESAAVAAGMGAVASHLVLESPLLWTAHVSRLDCLASAQVLVEMCCHAVFEPMKIWLSEMLLFLSAARSLVLLLMIDGYGLLLGDVELPLLKDGPSRPDESSRRQAAGQKAHW